MYEIRQFQDDDTQQVIELWTDCALTRPWNNPSLDIFRKMALNDGLFLVAYDNTATLSGLAGTIMGGYDGHRGWINYLAVHPECRRQGLGQKLVNNIEQRLIAIGCPKINLQVRHGNDEVISFYESLGFADDQCISMGKRLIKD